MRLVELRVKNFRGLGGNQNAINFNGSDVIFLIGQNNTGKSSFLHAYDFFVTPKQKASVSDFFKCDLGSPIEIEADFLREADDVDNPDFSNEPEWIAKWVQEDTGLITIKKVWTEPDKLFDKFTKGKNGDFVKNGFGGIDTLFTKYAPTPIFINAIETTESLEKRVNEVIEKEHLKQLESNYKIEYDAAVAAIRNIQKKVTSSETIEAYNVSINASFQKVFPSLTLKISIKDEDQGIDVIKAFKTNHSIDVKKTGVDRKETFSQHGHGVIRQALFNFFAFLKCEQGGCRKEYLLLFEEPELYLHPKSTRLLREELYTLAADSPFQVLCCTHAPQMIDISRPHCSLVRVCKEADETTITHQVGHSIFQDEVNKDFVQMINRFNPNVCEVFYASTVCIVEGDTEAVVCRGILDTTHPTADVFVLNAGSKNNMPFFQRILNHFRIPYVIIHDSDTRYCYEDAQRIVVRKNMDGTPRANSAWALNSTIWNHIVAGKDAGNRAVRLVSVFDFESANGYEMNNELGKPLSAYKFTEKHKDNVNLPIRKFIDQVFAWEFPDEWNMEQLEARVAEPFGG
jgi:predicted ATP-dependent endonuclease of OLD family